MAKLTSKQLEEQFSEMVRVLNESMILISNQEYIVLNSSQEELFNNYLLMRLGFTHGAYKDKYLEILQQKSHNFKYLLGKKIVRDTITKEIHYPLDNSHKSYKEKNNLLVPSRYSISDILMLEFNIKNNKQYINIEKPSSFISATDISNFTYCPVSWAISKTYSLPKSESARVGTLFHEEHKLLNYIKIGQSVNIDKSRNYSSSLLRKLALDSGAKNMLTDIDNSVAVYVGLSQKNGMNHYFKGKDIYVGQPDYIFFNYKTKKYFVVEEKFHQTSQSIEIDKVSLQEQIHYGKTVFYENHLNQTRSYIYGILDFEISYGYLAYWKYINYSNTPSYLPGSNKSSNLPEPEIKQLHAKIIDKNDDNNRKNLIKIYKRIKRVREEGRGVFDPSKLSFTKCISCVNYMLCGHKTKQFNEYSFPYSNKFIETKTRAMPEELKQLVKKIP